MKKKYVILLIILVLIIGVFITGAMIKSSIESNLEQLTSLTISDIDLSTLEDGTYKGSYKVFPIDVEVRVTMENHRIAGIDLVKHTNGQGASAEIIPGKVVDAQSLEVDAVSGATYSSKVILKAIENALIGANK